MTVPTPEFQTGRIHNVVVERFGELRLVLTDVLARPLKDQACRLVIGETTQELTTDSEGVLKARAPLRSAQAKLFIGEEEEPLELLLGHLNPVSMAEGVQGRLNNLGYDCGEVDGNLGPQTEAALAAFQRAEDLEATGAPDDDTRAKLVERRLSYSENRLR